MKTWLVRFLAPWVLAVFLCGACSWATLRSVPDPDDVGATAPSTCSVNRSPIVIDWVFAVSGAVGGTLAVVGAELDDGSGFSLDLLYGMTAAAAFLQAALATSSALYGTEQVDRCVDWTAPRK